MERLEQIFENEVLKNLKEGKISGKSIKELPVLFEKRKRNDKYTHSELSYIMKLNDLGIPYGLIAKSISRTETSVRNRCVKFRTENGTYNKGHIEEKYNLNDKFLKYLEKEDRVMTILDAYSGSKPFWTKYEKGRVVLTNDINKDYPAKLHFPAEDLVKVLYEKEYEFDVVDLDPFNTPMKCFDNAIKICNRGLIMTFGDKRGIISNKNLAKERYGCRVYDERKIIQHYIRRAKKFGMKLRVWKFVKWKMTWRVYFKVLTPSSL